MSFNKNGMRRVIHATKKTDEFKYLWDEGSANSGLKFKVPHRNQANAYKVFLNKIDSSLGGVATSADIIKKTGLDPKKVKNRHLKGIHSISVNTNPHPQDSMDYVYSRDFDSNKDIVVTKKQKNKRTLEHSVRETN